ncbi:MAG: HAMP domain-containing sensor histidine kinase [Methylococcales bacterium]
MDKQQNSIDFSTILATSIHDMKNSLGIMTGLVQRKLNEQSPPYDPDIVQLEFEANRLSNSLMQLLVLYKIESERFMLSLDEYPANDLLEDIVAQNRPLLDGKGIDLEVDCDADILVYCDFGLVCSIFNNLLNNAVRYTAHRIRLSAVRKSAYSVLTIEDDGGGYPESILNRTFLDQSGIDFYTGNTGLGLLFASHIAALHKGNGTEGYINLANEGRYGGACFSLFLPC